MLRYLLERLGHGLLVLWGAITLSFIIIQLTPGDPVRLMLAGGDTGDAGSADDAQIAELRAELGLDQPVLIQYVAYIWRIITLDWGYSMSKQRDVVAVISDDISHTVQLGALSIALMVLLGVLFAIGSSLLPSQALRQGFQSLTVLSIGVPSFVMAILLLQFFSFNLGWFPAFGAGGFQALILPSITIALLGAGTLSQVFARSIRETQREGHVDVATAKGMTPWQVLRSHVLRNASLPVYTIVGMLVGGIVAGAAIIETIFGRPGIGNTFVTAVEARDFPLIQVLIVLTGGIYVLVTLLVDLTYPLIDPRVISPVELRKERSA